MQQYVKDLADAIKNENYAHQIDLDELAAKLQAYIDSGMTPGEGGSDSGALEYLQQFIEPKVNNISSNLADLRDEFNNLKPGVDDDSLKELKDYVDTVDSSLASDIDTLRQQVEQINLDIEDG